VQAKDPDGETAVVCQNLQSVGTKGEGLGGVGNIDGMIISRLRSVSGAGPRAPTFLQSFQSCSQGIVFVLNTAVPDWHPRNGVHPSGCGILCKAASCSLQGSILRIQVGGVVVLVPPDKDVSTTGLVTCRRDYGRREQGGNDLTGGGRQSVQRGHKRGQLFAGKRTMVSRWLAIIGNSSYNTRVSTPAADAAVGYQVSSSY
jgi:hypothetical protein